MPRRHRRRSTPAADDHSHGGARRHAVGSGPAVLRRPAAVSGDRGRQPHRQPESDLPRTGARHSAAAGAAAANSAGDAHGRARRHALGSREAVLRRSVPIPPDRRREQHRQPRPDLPRPGTRDSGAGRPADAHSTPGARAAPGRGDRRRAHHRPLRRAEPARAEDPGQRRTARHTAADSAGAGGRRLAGGVRTAQGHPDAVHGGRGVGAP